MHQTTLTLKINLIYDPVESKNIREKRCFFIAEYKIRRQRVLKNKVYCFKSIRSPTTYYKLELSAVSVA